MNIVILDAYTLNPGDLSWEKLESLGNLTIYDRTPIDQIVIRAQEADILLTNKTPLSAETLRQLTRTKYIGVLATGYNVVDVQEATRLNITVTNVPDYGTNAVAQHVFALLLELTSHVGHHNQQIQQGRWSQSSDFCFWDYPLFELSGKTFGVYGYGRIGKAAAKIAVAFGMNVLAYDHDRVGQDGDIEKVDLETFLKRCDIISLHVPLTSQTHHIINESSIAKMKHGVMLINTSRGPLIDEIALREALLSQKVKAAGLDVASVEPIRNDYPLLGLDNCILTPHIAWAPIEARQRLLDIVVKNLEAYQLGEPINKVNP